MGVYNFVLKASLDGSTVTNSDVIWSVTILDGCLSTILSTFPVLSAMTTNFGSATATLQAFTDISDSVSLSYDTTLSLYTITSNSPIVTSGPGKGSTTCGSRSYVIGTNC